MAISPSPGDSGRTFIYDGLAQNDVDMAHHRLINLDTSNLPPVGIPPSIHPPANNWLHDWDAATHTWGTTQPTFADIGPTLGTLTPQQQERITALGTIRSGTWSATPLLPERLPTLDLILAPQGDVSMNSKRITNVAMAIDSNDAVNLAFVEAMIPGLKPKEAVRLASASQVINPSDLLTIDGIHLEDGNRVLLKNQPASRGYQNGIWIAHIGPWERPDDFDAVPDDGELVLAAVHVTEGTENTGTTWVQIRPSPVHIDIDASHRYPNFILFDSSQASVVAGAGLEKVAQTLNVLGTPNRIVVGATVDIDSAYSGQTSITTLGLITSGTWGGDIILGVRGGTGVNNNNKTITLAGNLATVIPVDFPDVGVGRNLSFKLKDHTDLYLPTTGTLATTTGAEILKNKVIVKRTHKIASAVKPAINVDTTDVFHITGLNEDITSMTDNLTGTPDNGQELFIWIKSAEGSGPPGTSINWGAKYTASGDLPLPVSLGPFERTFCWFIYNDDINLWVLTQNVRNLL